MVALTAVMSGDQSSGSDGALPPRHRERALSLVVVRPTTQQQESVDDSVALLFACCMYRYDSS